MGMEGDDHRGGAGVGGGVSAFLKLPILYVS